MRKERIIGYWILFNVNVNIHGGGELNDIHFTHSMYIVSIKCMAGEVCRANRRRSRIMSDFRKPSTVCFWHAYKRVWHSGRITDPQCVVVVSILAISS